jgi:hypothetical protein
MADDRDALREWHRLFGLLLTDLFTDSPFVVEMERDLSQQQQFLDVIVVRRSGERFSERLPDGLDDLIAHNLITFKSHHESLDAWAMKELIGHYVAYRKLVSRSPSELLAEDAFHLYAVCARFPHNLSIQVPWRERQAGVYDCSWGTDTVRVVVAGQLPQETHNAPLHLFSAAPEVVSFGQGAYHLRSQQASVLLRRLLKEFRREGFAMTYTMADFKRDYIKEELPQLTAEERKEVLQGLSVQDRREFLASLPLKERRDLLASLPEADRRELLKSLPIRELLAGIPVVELLERVPVEERLAGVPVEERLAGVPVEERLAGVPVEERLAGVPVEERLAGVPVEERLAGLPVDQIQQYLDRMTARSQAKTRKKRPKK